MASTATSETALATPLLDEPLEGLAPVIVGALLAAQTTWNQVTRDQSGIRRELPGLTQSRQGYGWANDSRMNGKRSEIR